MIQRLFSTIRLGFKSLMLHKLRSGLAMLGIMIGVTAVIWLVAMGEGVSYQAQQQIKDLGATNVIVRSMKPSSGSTTGSSFIIEYGLTRDDYQRILEGVPTIRRAVPMREIKGDARAGSRESEIQLLGVTPDYRDMNHLLVERGRFLSDRDVIGEENVCVLAAGAATNLFAHENPVGRKIEIQFNGKSDVYKVIGQTADRTPSAAIGGSLAGRDFNTDVYIPLSTLRLRIGDQVITSRSGSREGEIVQLSQITVTVGEVEEVEEAAGIIEILLEKYHPLGDYAVVVPSELLRQAEMLRMMFNVLLILIAGISLLVGGIGIMNIMLATVTERTREIGIRRALGATQEDVIIQFLAETIVLSAAGGMIGVVFGFGCIPATYLAQTGMERWLPEVWSTLPTTIRDLQPRIAIWSIIASFLISVGVGVLFGLYPARRAAMMDPIEALRHE
ncbi:ABC transporter permease [Blastopirellula sp. J2-11]|uniref:ABC transporter permease n=1 Tax=Blastopirellula sp. J2-11 TaxID=2943192 RepID=UPI0021C8F8E2|nr:ABC transporter permease [Blastopirellula sp. J2-11]UUO07101.1 ABC transporter permease [Blastopirellula sp. J2-11]